MSSCWRLRQVQRGFSDPCRMPLSMSLCRLPVVTRAVCSVQQGRPPAGSTWFLLVLLQEMDGSQCPSRVQHELNSITRKARQAPEHLRGQLFLPVKSIKQVNQKTLSAHTLHPGTRGKRNSPQVRAGQGEVDNGVRVGHLLGADHHLGVLGALPFRPPGQQPFPRLVPRSDDLGESAFSGPLEILRKGEARTSEQRGRGRVFSLRSTEAMCGGLWKFTEVGLENVGIK